MNLPADLVEKVTEGSNQSLTEIVREALQKAMYRQAHEELLELRESGEAEGFKYSWQELRALDDD